MISKVSDSGGRFDRKQMDDILDYGDAGVSPIVFSNAVHNAAVSYVSRTLGIKGPTMLASNFQVAFPLKHMAKDLRLAVELGADEKVATPTAIAASSVFEQALSEDLGNLDFSSVLKIFQD